MEPLDPEWAGRPEPCRGRANCVSVAPPDRVSEVNYYRWRQDLDGLRVPITCGPMISSRIARWLQVSNAGLCCCVGISVLLHAKRHTSGGGSTTGNGLSEQIFARTECLLNRAGRPVDAGIGGDPNEGSSSARVKIDVTVVLGDADVALGCVKLRSRLEQIELRRDRVPAQGASRSS